MSLDVCEPLYWLDVYSRWLEGITPTGSNWTGGLAHIGRGGLTHIGLGHLLAHIGLGHLLAHIGLAHLLAHIGLAYLLAHIAMFQVLSHSYLYSNSTNLLFIRKQAFCIGQGGKM